MPSRTRAGFTLIELLIVLVVIALLVGLLVPAVLKAVTTTNEAVVRSELSSLEQALAAFRSQYGAYPPSRIVIAEDGDYSTASLGPVLAPLGPRSVSWLRRFWPRLRLNTDGTKPKIQNGWWYDVNGDHVKNTPYVLEGHECLVLFLGGIPFQAKSEWGVTGFGKDPANPFTSAVEPPAGQNWPYADVRTRPFFDFPSARLVPTPNKTMTGMGPALGFTDFFSKDNFVVYFSSYEGAGYDPDDVNFVEPDTSNLTTAACGGFQASNAPTGVHRVAGRSDLVSSPSPNPYLADSPVAVDSAGALDPNERRKRLFQKADSYQLLTAGADRLFGIGGEYAATGDELLPFYGLANQTVTGQTLNRDVRYCERDNVVNFVKRRLD